MHEIKHHYQEGVNSCGSACLLIAYHALGIDYNELPLAMEMGLESGGANWQTMMGHPVALGFPIEFKNRSNYKSLKKDFKRGVCIVAWSHDGNAEPAPHFSVVSGIVDDLIELTDPGLPPKIGPRIMTKEDFVNKWFAMGYIRSVLLIKPKRS